MSVHISWFAARVVLESQHPNDTGGEPLFEDRIFLIRAANEDEARSKARSFGKAAKEQYINAEGRQVVWVFRELLDVKWIADETLEDGSEVYSTLLDQSELDQLRSALRLQKLPA